MVPHFAPPESGTETAEISNIQFKFLWEVGNISLTLMARKSRLCWLILIHSVYLNTGGLKFLKAQIAPRFKLLDSHDAECRPDRRPAALSTVKNSPSANAIFFAWLLHRRSWAS